MLYRKVWKQEEDQLLLKIMGEFDLDSVYWTKISHAMKEAFPPFERNGKQCRERWFNHLNPGIKKGEWTIDQFQRLVTLVEIYGKSWTRISAKIKGRTENSIKNCFYSTCRRAYRMIKIYASSKKVHLKDCNVIFQSFLNFEKDLFKRRGVLRSVLTLGAKRFTPLQSQTLLIQEYLAQLADSNSNSATNQTKLEQEKIEDSNQKQLEELRCQYSEQEENHLTLSEEGDISSLQVGEVYFDCDNIDLALLPNHEI